MNKNGINNLEKVLVPYSRGYVEVDLDSILFNMDNMKKNLKDDTKIIAVIKTDGYGHGAVPIARELEKIPYVWGYAVATAEEADILRGSKIEKPILILGYTFPYCYENLIQNEIRPTVFRLDMAKELSEVAIRLGKKAKVHIKVDTGMSRIGIKPDDSGIRFIEELLKLPGIETEGIFTHFAKADEADKTAVTKQLHVFQNFIASVEEHFPGKIKIKHCSNSAGIIEINEANMDIVRAGITLYGLWPSNEVAQDIVALKPALSLKSHIVYIKEIEKGTQISYGGTFEAEEKMKIATIPLGYGDGYPRSLSNKGYVLIHGKKAKICGRVCMDQFMVDITDIPEAIEGDEVILIGEELTCEFLGELSGRFNYELVCDLSKRLPRVYKKNKKIIYTKDYYHDYE